MLISKRIFMNFHTTRQHFWLCLYAFCSMLYACQSSKDIAFSVSKGHGDLPQKRYFENPEYVYLEDKKPEAVLRYVDKVLLLNNRIVVSDDNGRRLVMFDRFGTFIASTDKMRGKGANEYIQFSDCCIDEKNQQIYMYCDKPYQYMVFDSNLKLKKIIKTKDLVSEFSLDNKYLYALCHDVENPECSELRRYYRTNISGKYEVLLRFDGCVKGVGSMGHSLCGNGDHIFFAMPFSNEIHEINNGKVINSISIDFGEEWFSSAENKRFYGRRFQKKNADKNWIIQNVCASDSVMFFNTNQAPFYKVSRTKDVAESYKFFKDTYFPYSISWFTPTCGNARQIVFEIPASAVMDYLKFCKKKQREIMPCLKNLATTDSVTNPLLQIMRIR